MASVIDHHHLDRAFSALSVHVAADVYGVLLFDTTALAGPVAAAQLRVAAPRVALRVQAKRPACPGTAAKQPPRPTDVFDAAAANALKPGAPPIRALSAPLRLHRPPPLWTPCAPSRTTKPVVPARARLASGRKSAKRATLVVAGTREDQEFLQSVGPVACVVLAVATVRQLEAQGQGLMHATAVDLTRCCEMTTLPDHIGYMDALPERAAFPHSLTAIGSSCGHMSALTELDFTQCSGLRAIGDNFATAAGSLERVRLPASVTSIGDNFAVNSALPEIDLSHCGALERVGAFFGADCKCLSRVDLPKSIRSIGVVFCSNSGVAVLDLSGCSELTDIPDLFASRALHLERVALPCGVKRIGNGFCEDAASLREIDLSRCSNLTAIGDAFASGAQALSGSMVLPPSLRRLGRSFCAMTQVTTIDLSGCTQLEAVGAAFLPAAASVQLPAPA